EQPEEVIEEPEIFTVVEDMPVFPGCENADNKEQCTQDKIFEYLGSNTKYPPMAKDAGISGTVYIRFLVDENGDVRDAEVLRGVSGGKSLDEEALRVVRSLPKMKPGKQRGQAVRVQYNVPVRFNLR
ncbi:MAG: energy transducer TonB, partial [Vicingaceae bacterium]